MNKQYLPIAIVAALLLIGGACYAGYWDASGICGGEGHSVHT